MIRLISIGDKTIEITVKTVPVNSLRLYTAVNNYGEPKVKPRYFKSARAALNAEIKELKAMLA